jgi:uncharacterized protein YjbI with pentapeptide repeats
MLGRCGARNRYGRRICRRRRWKEDHHGLCFLHSGEEKDPVEFQERFLKELAKLQRKHSSYSIDFSHLVFPDVKLTEGLTISTRQFPFSISFSNAQFMGVADFRNVSIHMLSDFIGAEFYGEANFEGSSFYETSFWRSRFHQKARFENVQFLGNVDFVDGEFRGEAEFRGAKMAYWADFTGAKFRDPVDFSKADIREALFMGSQFFEDVDFKNTKFRRKGLFPTAHFMGKAHVLEAEFRGDVDFQGAESDQGDSGVAELLSRREKEWRSRAELGTTKTFNDVMNMAKHLGDEIDDYEVPMEIERFTQLCRDSFTKEGKADSHAFLLTLDNEKMAAEIPGFLWVYYGAVKAYVDLFGDCPGLLIALAENCMLRTRHNGIEGRYYLQRAIDLDPENPWVLWMFLLENDPCVYRKDMFEKTGLHRRTWKDEVGLLDRILKRKPGDPLATLLREKMVRNKKRLYELDEDFRYGQMRKFNTFNGPGGGAYLRSVLPDCINWRKRHKSVGEGKE